MTTRNTHTSRHHRCPAIRTAWSAAVTALVLLCTLLRPLPASAELSMDDAYRSITRLALGTARFGQLCPQEKVYLHFDNTAYYQGDIVWFSASVVDAATGAPSASRVLYVELLSPSGTLLRQLKLKVTDGRVHGSLPLVDNPTEEARALRGVLSYPSGFYEVRAYTRAMLNFDHSAVFSRVFPVYQQPAVSGDYSQPVLGTSMASWQQQDRPKTDSHRDLSVTFYPEGGTLVRGVPCRVAFKAIGADGEGVDIVGTIKDEEGGGETQALLATLHDGMGAFTFVPTRKRHTAVVTYDGRDYRFSLPDSDDEGAALQVDAVNGESIVGQLSLPQATQRALGTPCLGITLHSCGKLCAVDTLHIAPGDGIAADGWVRYPFALSRAALPTGVHQLTVFTPSGNVLAQRLLFVDNGVSAVHLTATPDKRAYAPYEKVSVQFQATAADGTPVAAPFSLSVRDNHDQGTAYSDDVLTYMLLSSELKGYVSHPDWYFQSADRLHRQALDLLMLTQGWTRCGWRQMAGVEPFAIRHYTEDGLVLDGQLLSRMKDKPIAGATITMRITSPDRQQKQTSSVVTDGNGCFGFSVEEFDDTWDMVLNAADADGKPLDARIRLDRASRPELRCYDAAELVLPQHPAVDDEEPLPTFAPQWMQLNPDSVYHLDVVEIEGRRKYIDYLTFKAYNVEEDAEYMLDQGRFTYKVSDYLREKGYDIDCSNYIGVVPDDIRERDDFIRWSLSQCLLNNHRVLWYLHDEHRNLATSGFTPGFDVDMEDVRSIIVYDRCTEYESMPIVRQTLTHETIESLHNSADGGIIPPGLYVIDVAMYPAGLRRSKVKGQRQTTFRGYTPTAGYYSPEYPDGPIAGDEDYRRTLYWNPDVRTDGDGRAEVTFYNNSRTRTFVFDAQGWTADGVPVVNTK